jgi:DNA helicase HerA-like ATPase
MNSPRLYSTFLLWLLAELFEQLPEVGDLDKPKLVFFFDEAHLLFNDAPPALLQKIEQVVRLIRSKGVGVYFVTQNPLDVPDTVLAQLGNRVQHALRAFTPRDQKAVKAAADTLRANPAFDAASVITELGVGEVLVSFLDDHGRPTVVERGFVLAPVSRIGPLTAEERRAAIAESPIAGHYEKALDRESAYEKLQASAPQAAGGGATQAGAVEGAAPPAAESSGGGFLGGLGDTLGGMLGGGARSGTRGRQTVVEAAVSSTVRAIGSSLGREIVRGVLGSIMGGRRR